MQNIVSFGLDRPRPQRLLGVPRDGARILFFTGVRYCRDEVAPPCGDANGGAEPSSRQDASGRVLDAAAH